MDKRSFQLPRPPQPPDPENDGEAVVAGPVDPSHRLGRLKAANRKPISVTPSDRMEIATTLMLANDFSQLPVMSNERTVKGIVSW